MSGLSLPRLSTATPVVAQSGAASPQFQAYWQGVLESIEGAYQTLADQEAALAAAESELAAQQAALNAQVAKLEAVLAGDPAYPFTGLNADGTNVIAFLGMTNGSAIIDPAGLGPAVVSTAAVMDDAITLPASVDSAAPAPASATIKDLANANLSTGDFFTIGSETWTAAASGSAPFTWIIGATDVLTAANIASAIMAGSSVVSAAVRGVFVDLTTYTSGSAANSTASSFTAVGAVGASITAFSGGSSTFAIGGGAFYPMPDADATFPVVGGDVEFNGTISYTHNQTSTALLHVKIDRLKSPAGALPYSYQITLYVPGLNGLVLDGAIYFRDDQLNGAVGNATYRLSFEITNNSGGGYLATVSSVLVTPRNYKR